jgi:hypothetical protein
MGRLEGEIFTLYNILLSSLNPYADEIIEIYLLGFRHNKSINDQIFVFLQILEERMGVQ